MRSEVELSGAIDPDAGIPEGESVFGTPAYTDRFLHDYFVEERAQMEAQAEALKQAEGTISDLRDGIRELAGVLELSPEDWGLAMKDPNFPDIFHYCLTDPPLNWAEAYARWAQEEGAKDASWDGRLDRLNRLMQKKFRPRELRRIDHADASRRSHRKPPTKKGLTSDPQMLAKLKLRFANKQARRTQATATDAEIAAALNVEDRNWPSGF